MLTLDSTFFFGFLSLYTSDVTVIMNSKKKEFCCQLSALHKIKPLPNTNQLPILIYFLLSRNFNDALELTPYVVYVIIIVY